jgi:DNA-binding response OmpR family regulator
MKAKVLVVDDESDFVQLAEYNLGMDGFEVFSAENGVQALHEARSILPDVILLDLMLPDIDGGSVFEILQSQPSTADVPVIVVSALDGMIMRSKKPGHKPAGFFQKPVDLKKLGECLRSVIADQEDMLRARLGDENENPKHTKRHTRNPPC